MHPLVHEMMDLFEGCKSAYGIYVIPKHRAAGKVKGQAATIKEPITTELWSKHLTGEQGIGVIPINEASQAKFGAIDIDDYNLDLNGVLKLIEVNKLPLVPCRTKSGGLHCYLFLTEPVAAVIMKERLQELAAFIGFGTSEIYPRQTRILTERGDMGIWLNMPYFSESNTNRYAYDSRGRHLEIRDFIKLAESRRLTPEQLTNYKLEVVEFLVEGPPCLQQLISQGFMEGTRNNGLFSLGVYARKFNPDKWKSLVEEYNNRFMKPPLTVTEVQGVIKSLDKKDYNYPCNDLPLKPFCNAPVCKTKKFGVGANLGMPVMGTLTKLCTKPPLWFIDIEGGDRLELATEDLQNPVKFQHRCMEVLNMMPIIHKRDAWQAVVSELLGNLTVIPVPEEATPEGQLLEHLESFCTDRVQAKDVNEVLLGKPWTVSNGVKGFPEERHYFRLKDFMAYLERKKFKEFKMNKITNIIRDNKAEHHFLLIKGKGVNLWSIPRFSMQKDKFEVVSVIDDVAY